MSRTYDGISCSSLNSPEFSLVEFLLSVLNSGEFSYSRLLVS
jgi:hypothetical protein